MCVTGYSYSCTPTYTHTARHINNTIHINISPALLCHVHGQCHWQGPLFCANVRIILCNHHKITRPPLHASSLDGAAGHSLRSIVVVRNQLLVPGAGGGGSGLYEEEEGVNSRIGACADVH